MAIGFSDDSDFEVFDLKRFGTGIAVKVRDAGINSIQKWNSDLQKLFALKSSHLIVDLYDIPILSSFLLQQIVGLNRLIENKISKEVYFCFNDHIKEACDTLRLTELLKIVRKDDDWSILNCLSG